MSCLVDTRSNHIVPYLVAIMIPILALFAAFLFAPIVKTTLLFFIIAVLFSAWYGGLKPGLLCGLFSGILLNYFLLEPRFEFIPNSADLPLLILFAVVVVLISVVEESRLRTERALRQSRDQLEIILEGIRDGVIAQSPNGQPIFANQAASRIIGYQSVSDLLNTPLSQTRNRLRFYDQNAQAVSQADLPSTKAFAEGIDSQMLMHWQYADASPDRWINLRSVPVFDNYGKVQVAISIFSDVTEEKEAEIKLRNQHEWLQTVLASISKGVISTDTEGRIDLINPMAETLTGWQKEKAIGMPFESVVTITDPNANGYVISPVRAVLRDRTAINVISPHVLISNTGIEVPIDFNAAPIKDENGLITGTVIVFRDISERQKADHERAQLTLLLAAQQKRLENILANVPGIVWESIFVSESQQQRLEFVNSYAEKVLGYTREEWFSAPNFVEKIVHPDDVESSQKEARDIFESGKLSAAIQFRCIAKDGHIVPIEAHYTILTDDKGKVVGTCGLMMDISQRKADENALQQSALDLKRSNEQLEQFAYVASHDLQEPLRMVTSYLQLLERRYKDQLDQDANEFIAFAVDGASRMKALINDLLAYSRVKTNEHDFARFETKAALEQAISNLQMSIAETDVQITYDLLPSILGNQPQFVQLFQNLLSNAIKFRREQPPQISIKAERTGNLWKFSVQDNGIGIEPQYVDRIFVIFQRLHTKDSYPGTGIGLAICKKVVEHHGGRIWAESTPGTGTIFQFTIPVR